MAFSIIDAHLKNWKKQYPTGISPENTTSDGLVAKTRILDYFLNYKSFSGMSIGQFKLPNGSDSPLDYYSIGNKKNTFVIKILRTPYTYTELQSMDGPCSDGALINYEVIAGLYDCLYGIQSLSFEYRNRSAFRRSYVVYCDRYGNVMCKEGYKILHRLRLRKPANAQASLRREGFVYYYKYGWWDTIGQC